MKALPDLVPLKGERKCSGNGSSEAMNLIHQCKTNYVLPIGIRFHQQF